MPDRVFFTPAGGWVGDLIPHEQDGDIWLYYLYERRAEPKPGTPWSLVKTRDLLSFADHGVALPHGSEEHPDFNVYTGCIVTNPPGVHHAFYTGQNPTRRGHDGQPLQLVMHASSTDGMRTWRRHPEHSFGATPGYETADWRDPFVMWDEERGLWRMLIAARHTEGPSRRRGVIAQCVSTDLEHWTAVQPFWDPGLYVTHECPEVFQLGNWWYLVYSEFSDAFATRYRLSRSQNGPWQVPDRDTIDGRAFYAVKSAALEGRRLFFGWIPTREGDTDDGAWQWAGSLSILEASQNSDGSLAFHLPGEIVASFDTEVPTGLGPTALDAPDGFACVVGTQLLPEQCFIKVEFDIDPRTTQCGLLLRTDPEGDLGYIIRLEPKRGRMVLDRWPRRITGTAQWQISGDVPYVIELERPADLKTGHHTLEVIVENNLAVVVLDRQVSLSTRLYDHPSGRLGLFVGQGAAKVTNLQVLARSSL